MSLNVPKRRSPNKSVIQPSLCQLTEEKSPHPLCPMKNIYDTTTLSGYFETPQLSDEVRFLLAERCTGDIQGLIESYDDTNITQLSYLIETLYYMCLMVFHTLILFDSILDGYSHKDLGARNVLYTWDPHQNPNTYWRYNFPASNGIFSIDIPTTTFIPKIWDFAFVRYATAHLYSQYYTYLTDKCINETNCPGAGISGTLILPKLDTITGEDRENDVYVLLNDINLLLQKIGVTGSNFNTLNFDSLRSHHNNTAAVYDFLLQWGVPKELLASNEHKIIHVFPPNNDVFLNTRVDRNIMKHD